MKTKLSQLIKRIFLSFVALVAMLVAPSAFAASQSWTNAPVDSDWQNTNNWVARAVPGGINLLGATVNNDTATFSNAIPGSLFGSAALPIIIDDATYATNNGPVFPRGRQIGSIVFSENAGAYVFYSPSPAVVPGTNILATGILYVSHNGNITMNSTATNSQVFLVPIRVRLPNSTAGMYNLVNNATNPAANLILSTIIHDGANTRATTFNLGGTNTGNNIVTNFSEGVGNGTGGFTKSGSGTWVIAGTSVFPAASPLNINEGTLAVLVADAFGAATTATVTNTGVLRCDGVTLNQISLNLRKGGTIKANGTLSVNGVAVGAQTATTATLSTTSASDVFTVGTALAAGAFVTGGAADTVLNTAGPGTLVFGQVNTYIGKWSFNAATNQISNASALGTGLNANVGAGAILDTTPFGAISFVPTTAGFGGSGTGTAVGTTAATVLADVGGTFDLSTKNINLTFTPTAFTGDTTHPALYIAQGGLTLSGNTFFINNASGTPLGVGTYRIIQSAGSITDLGGYAALISGSGTVGGTTTAIVVSGGNVDLVISVYTPKNLVWTGGLNANWNVATDANWLNGVVASVFNNSDVVAFNTIGSTNPTATLVGTLAPASAVVDTSANDYTFSGAGQVGGTASLTKKSAGVLNLNTVNSYAGGTVVSNGTLRVGANNAISSVGAGNVAVYGSGVIDLNNFSDTINGLNGDGSVDNQAGGAATLTIGNNDNSGNFSGVLKNTSGSLALTKVGNGSETLTASNSYSGGTTVSAGTLATGNGYALGNNTVTVNAGTLDVKTDLHVGSLAGAGGSIANNSTATTNTISVEGGATTTCGASIVDGSGGGGIALKVLSGSLTLSGINTYTGGTTVGNGASFLIANGPAAVTGGVIASNGAIVGLGGGGASPGATPTFITTVDGAKVLFTSGAEGKLWGGQFNGSATATNRFIGSVSASGPLSFSNFLGVVEFANTNTANSNFRFFNGAGISGGENTLFVFERCYVHTRDSQTVRLGAIVGGNNFAGIGDQAGIVSWEIGAKNTSTSFQGFILGVNNSIVKVGAGTLTLDGRMYSTNTVTLPDTSVVAYTLFTTNAITYSGTTTISNGTLKVIAPNNLTNSSNIIMAGGVLDATMIGYSTNQTTLDIGAIEQATNTVVVTTGTVEIRSGSSLTGNGTILGGVQANAGSTVSPGFSIGSLTNTGVVTLNGATVNMELNRSNLSQNCDIITGSSIAGSGSTLNVTNIGPTLINGSTFQLFSGPVTAFTTVNLPATSADGSFTYVWTDNLAANGSVTLFSGGLSTTPPTLTNGVSGSNLVLSWAADHKGWTLQGQTNGLSIGISNNWITVTNSAATNMVFAPIVPGNPTVFYRLILPLP